MPLTNPSDEKQTLELKSVGTVLVILHFINPLKRKYEIGILRFIGMKKRKVAL